MAEYCIVSGGFDPIHEGHIKLIQECCKMSDGVIILLNSDTWLTRKKGRNFQNFQTRKQVCQNIKGVIDLIEFDDVDGSASDGLKIARDRYPNHKLIFANGGDRTADNIPESAAARKYNIKLMFGVGGDYKLNSSSEILKIWDDKKPKNYQKVALITGITGQDGSYLAEFLLNKGYIVHGIKRRSSSLNTERIDHIYNDSDRKGRFFLHYGDMTDSTSLIKIISKTQPTEIYNLAAQSHVKVSWDCPEYTAEADGTGTLRLLDAIVICKLENKVKFYQASTSELYGLVQETPQTETTPFYPRSPYAVAKLYSYWITINYRESHNMYACNGILFNHESPRRGETFVTRKITRGIAKIKHGLLDKLRLGNLDALRDWGHAKDYVEGMWLMLQQEKPEDFVLATGITTSVRDFCTKAFAEVGINIIWQGSGINEKGIDSKTQKELVVIDPQYFRPTEVDLLLGDATKARTKLGWTVRYNLDALIKEMVTEDLKKISNK